MKRTLFLATALAAAAVFPADAAFISASFSGTVASQTATSLSIGNTVSGTLFVDTANSQAPRFTITGPGGFSQSFTAATTGLITTASVTPDQLTALFGAQNSQVQGAPSNSSFILDLEGLSAFGSTDPQFVASHLATLALDLNPADAPFNTRFGFNLYNASGTLTSSLTANITSLANITAAVPEPASMALMLTSLLGLRFARRRG